MRTALSSECEGVELHSCWGRMPSMYFHKELKLLLVIYVDDLKLAGPKENLAKGWEMLKSKLKIEPETDLGLYLVCLVEQRILKTPRWDFGINHDLYDMESLL